MKEVEAYKLFTNSPHIIHSVDYSIASERNDPSSKTVYVLLPYYQRGNLQDMINANLVNHTKFPERRLMELFLGVCRGLRDMHVYTGTGAGDGGGGRGETMTMDGTDENVKKLKGRKRGAAGADDEDEGEQQRPLMHGEEDTGVVTGGKERSYAHRDIKPGLSPHDLVVRMVANERKGNIMIADDGQSPILMDLGSIAESPLPITSRSLAIATQDTAAEHSTMPYRAPELFDVKTGSVIDTKVDIWSMGCTLYACLVGKSPFEMRSDETGGSLSMCVLGGDWRFPDEGPNRNKGKARAGEQAQPEEEKISEPIKEVVRRCLKVEPAERPDVDELIQMVEGVIRELPEDGA